MRAWSASFLTSVTNWSMSKSPLLSVKPNSFRTLGAGKRGSFPYFRWCGAEKTARHRARFGRISGKERQVEPRILARAEHPISPPDIDANVLQVLSRLATDCYQAALERGARPD